MPCLCACVLIPSYLPLHRLALTCQHDSTKHLRSYHPPTSIYISNDGSVEVRVLFSPLFLFLFLLVSWSVSCPGLRVPFCFFFYLQFIYIHYNAATNFARLLYPFWFPGRLPPSDTHASSAKEEPLQARAVLGSMEVLFPH